MSFFQNSVLNKHLKTQDETIVLAAFEKFKAYFQNPEIQQNIRDAKEEQFQEGFLRELFVNILGYTLNPQPNFNLTTELKNEKGAKKCDGAILENNKALGVIELKGTNTKDLDKINTQAFNYKNNQTGCIYVITSNFEKLRFFIHHSVDHLEFNLFTLTESEFKLLWICLSAENLFKGVPLKVKEESLLEEEKITKQLYKDYAAFRTDLWQNMVKNNAAQNKLLLFKKTQKLLDRFLFIFFAEDSGLLPPNSISRIVKRWIILKEEDAYKPLYEIFQQYFGYINKGRKGQKTIDDIFAYNGGLFKPDEILDNINLDDETIHPHVLKLTNYDFQSEVDVNILGHIFENSLNEIENITAELEGQEVDKSKNKRKKDGVFYTPKYITKYIVDNTVGKLCDEQKTKFNIVDEEYAKGRKNRKKDRIKQLDKNLQTYRNWLLNITICDPACGSGAFLNQALEFLMEEHAYIDELESQLLGHAFEFPGVENHILEKNIFGVDINEESVDIAKLSLWLRTAQRGRKLTTLNNNIKCGNSLIDDKAIAGDKAFNWQNEFPNVFKEKEKKAFHITTATHDSRTSQRMIDYKVRELRDNGTRPKADGIWLAPEDEVLITKTISEIVKEDELNVMAYNICGDHLHLLLVCEDEKVSKIIQKIKAKTARTININKGITIAKEHTQHSTREHAQYSTREHAPLPLIKHTPNEQAPLPTRSVKQNSLWTQKFGSNPIKDEKHLYNTVEYIQNNRKKHGLTTSKELQQLISDKILNQTFNQAFKPETKGGFDVVIGNPPYVNFANLPKNQREFFKRTSKVCKNKTDLYAFFVEKSTNILKSKGRFSFIFPHTWVSTTSFTPLRELFFDNYRIDNLVELEHGIFQDAIVKTVIIVCEKGANFNSVPIFDNSFNFRVEIPKDVILKDEEKIINFDWTPQKQKIEDRLLSGSVRLDSLLRFTRGIKTSNDKRFLHFEEKNDDYKKIIRGRNIKAYRIDFAGEYVWYRPDLMREKVGCLPHTKELFEVPEKLITQRVNSSGELLVTYDDNQYYFLDTTNVSVIEKPLEVNLKYVLVILNSRLINWWFNDKFKMPTISGYELHQIPIKIDKKIEDDIVAFGNVKLKQEPTFRNFLTQFTDLLQNKFEIEKLTTKLKNWHELAFKDFLKELKKAKVQLSLSEEAEWMQYFNEQQQEAQTLKAVIDKTDSEIDAMVYELYGLSEEEIKIVKQS